VTGSHAAPDGLVVVDKPAGWTSHDVVARIRRLAGTRRVGHAGTLDPMATGVLVVGVGRATRLLGLLTGHDKSYDATIRLGQRTRTDDADGEITGGATASGVTDEQVLAALDALRGQIEQVPSAVSAVQVAGRRAYARVRAGEQVTLAPRTVTVSRLELGALRRPEGGLLDVDLSLDCSAGTYVRALARDLGEALGVGGHLTALRRTRVGSHTLPQARGLDELARLPHPVTVPLSAAVAADFPTRTVSADEAAALSYGRPLPPAGIAGPYGVFGPDGEVVAIVAERESLARPLVVLRPAG